MKKLEGEAILDKRIWTASQLRAIEYKGKNLLVSAAAGSGKTATLTERIIRLITDKESGADISRMLVVTFTKAAAAELKERVSAALSEAAAADPQDRRITDQLCRVGDAMICTMDSFFLSCVRPMFSEVGLPSDFRIGDKAELAALREEAMEETVNFFFESSKEGGKDAFSELAEAVGSARSEEGIDGVLLDFEEEAERAGIGPEQLYLYSDELCRYAECDILDTPFGECIVNEILSGLSHYGRLAKTLGSVMAETPGLCRTYVPAAERAAAYCESCALAAKSGDTSRLRELLKNPPNDAIRTKEHTEESELFKKERGELLDFVKKIYSGYLADDAEVCSDVLRKTASICRGAGDIVGKFRDNFSELKRRRGLADYSDIMKMAARLLADCDGNPTPYGESVASQYDYVFIDEYQDTNIYQDRIFAAVASKCGRFMVGDIKQSIYRFRGGDPSVFAGYRRSWEKGYGGSTVFMSENFRCSSMITDFVNAVSKYMFPYGGIPFDGEDLLIHARREPEGYKNYPVEVCLIERPGRQTGQKPSAVPASGESSDASGGEGDIPPAAYLEAEYVAKRIRHMLDYETLPDGSAIKPCDIAIMVRDMKSRRGVISEIFGKYNIPLNQTDNIPLLDRPEILLLTCVLRTIDNPARDIYLAGAMRSLAFGFTLGEIAQIQDYYRKSQGRGCLWDSVRYSALEESPAPAEMQEKCRVFCREIGRYRTIAMTVDAAALVYMLIHEHKMAEAIESEGGAGAWDRAIQFYELARGKGCGLYEFLCYLEHLEKSSLETAEDGGGVSLITIHHSKGLEFPVCFLVDAGKKYNTNDSKKSMILDRSFGAAMKLPDESGLVRCDNHLRRLALFRSGRESALEEMRILYVAMTRARERLIITSVTSSPEKLMGEARMNARFYDEYSVCSKNDYIRIILEALNLYGGSFASIIPVRYEGGKETEASVITPEESSEKGEDLRLVDGDEAQRLADILEKRLQFKYAYGHLKNIPSKLTVSRLYPEILDEFNVGMAGELDEYMTDGFELDDMASPSAPKFLAGASCSPADAGSAAHVFLQFCNFEKLRDLGTGAELCRLVSEGYMSRADGEAANLEYIEKFRRSDFFRRILGALEIHREFRFNAAIPAEILTGDKEKKIRLREDGCDVVVQGVIDIVFTDSDGKLVLADYKTDRLTSYEMSHKSAAAGKLWRRHKNQLYYYSLVCEKLFGRAPDEVLIYSMPLGEEVRECEAGGL